MAVFSGIRAELPYAPAGARVGLLGGSFDPAHQGHVAITMAALKRFDLDQIWWLFSPGNPLKSRGPEPMARRMAHASGLIQHPRVQLTAIEAQIGTRFTADTLQALCSLYPLVDFTWLMGADNLADFHRWQDWRQIMQMMPVGVLARPGERGAGRLSPAARIFAPWRVHHRQSRILSHVAAPAWCFVNIPMNTTSSTQIRARGEW